MGLAEALAVANGEGLRLGLIVTTFGFGLRHGIDWDHIAAIADITSSQDAPRRSMLLATLYAVGHGLVVLVLGVIAIVFAERIPDSVDGAMERVVGMTLLALGAYVFYALVRHGRDFRMRSRWMLVFSGVRRLVRRVRARSGDTVVITHEHEHAADDPHPVDVAARQHAAVVAGATQSVSRWHTHRHSHVASMPDDPFLSYRRATAFGVGMIHGVGAETPTQVLLFLTAAGAGGRGTGVLLLVCFLAGLVISNTAIAVASTFGFLRASTNFTLYVAVSIVIATFSLVLGFLFLLGQGGALPAIFTG